MVKKVKKVPKIDIKLSKKWEKWGSQEIEVRDGEGKLRKRKLYLKPENVFRQINNMIESMMGDYENMYQLETAITYVEIVGRMLKIAEIKDEEVLLIYERSRNKIQKLKEKQVHSKKKEWKNEKRNRS